MEIQRCPYVCTYCEGGVIYSQENLRYEHAEDGERVNADSPGDYVSAAHNRKGTAVNAADVIDADGEDEPDSCESGGLEYTDVTDAAGYLECGCHGSQRDHTCKEPDRESAMRAEGGYDI